MPQLWLIGLLGRFFNTSRHQERQSKTRQKELIDDEPVRLPSHRRALSTSPPLQPRRRLLLSPTQPSPSSSPLLALPPEIRLKIFTYVVGGSTIHLIHLPSRLGHIRCTHHAASPPASTSTALDCLCVPLAPRPYQYRLTYPLKVAQYCKPDSANLALLKTCRQIYREGIALLYTANTFTVSKPHTLALLERTVRPERLALIRELHVTWSAAYFPVDQDHVAMEEWLDAGVFDDLKEPERRRGRDSFEGWWWGWKVVGTRMTGLRCLKVTLHGTSRGRGAGVLSDEDAERILRPLRRLRGLRVLEVLVMSELQDLDGLVAGMRGVVCGKG
jgi:hypothetical protein